MRKNVGKGNGEGWKKGKKEKEQYKGPKEMGEKEKR